MEENSKILTKSMDYVEQFLNEKLPAEFLYHNFNHAMDVYDNCIEISDAYNMPANEKEMLLIAALFHDTGFINKYEGHEEESVKFAEDYLRKENYPEENISEIKNLIVSTKADKMPSDLCEEIIHDADIAHIGKKDFFRKGELLRLELEKVKNYFFKDMEWQRK